MSNVLKVKIAGQRIRYQISKVTFADSDLLKANAWKWDDKMNSMYCNDNRLDILRDYETFDNIDAGVAIRTTGEIFYELENANGKITMNNVLSSLNHPILTAISDAKERDGLTLISADVYDEENTIYEYIIEVSDNKFDASKLEIITINDPITGEEYIVEVRYDGKKMKGGADGLLFRKPASDKSMFMLNVPNEYADALGLGENRKLDNILKFNDFINENTKLGKKPVNKVKSVKAYNEAVNNGYVKLREDYIHSFIDEHERGVEPEEEE